MSDQATADAILKMATAVGKVDGRLEGIDRHLSSVSASVKTIEISTNDIKTEVAGLKIKDNQQDGRMDKQDGRLDDIETNPSAENGNSVINLKIGKLNREMVILILGLVSLATGGGAWVWSFIK